MAEFDTGFAWIAGRFSRVEPRRQARSFLLGLLSDVDTRSCWQLAEQAGNTSPHAMQRLLGEAVWDADKVRDDVRGYVIDALGDPAGVLILDDTGDVKKGVHTVGVQRQYTGTAGRVENAQVTVYLAYAAPGGYTLIDRAVYLPKAWTDDPDRCAAAGIPADVGFATKLVLARRMLTRALDAGTPAAWATADEAYGGDRHLRRDLQTRGIDNVLAVAKSHHVTARPVDGPVRVDRLAADLPDKAWNRLSAGAGSKGARDYDWAWIAITPPPDETNGQHSLLIRRRISDGELAFYRCWSARPAALRTLVRVAGTRWSIETCFQTGKSIGLDEPQVRRWHAWHRHVTLVMLAHAILTVIASRERAHRPADHELIPLTLPEIRRLFAKLITNTVHTIDHWLTWSHWRRQHQARARTSHYRRRQGHQPAST
ncbi:MULTISPECIES: IS701 family transposase [Micromonospora]|uniref:IS701 family transposase n=1 Tax=Micromonospora solifontis TaxID=2487138 RepID=A0ABX9WAL3_9ACTN|nr:MULTISPECIES: IS701 family transposase [Micromonospora]NES17076.1 IS701 family transposase [Micromonospora sp. PPF5-17B]NES39563.1 IS701 family transposase [Micromonospora solifontis]NES57082.1 IS701 family transposase [Micromonospora sp. PPF5-6]RNL88174.1 IS701 family transposase [Micromonospora solifontis]